MKGERRSKSKLVAHIPKNKAKGANFGNIVKKVTKALGMADCDGCDERQKKLNRIRIEW